MRIFGFIGCCAAVSGFVLGTTVTAAPYRPASDATVVATLAGRLGREDAVGDAHRGASTPSAAVQLARQYVERARREGDPRYLGRALGVLSPWPDARQAPTDVAVLRATIHQSLHQFTLALGELDAVLLREPRHAQALLTRATVLQVTGRLADATRDCYALSRVRGGLVAVTCTAGVASLTGQGKAAYVMLDHTLRTTGDQEDPGVLAWSHSVLAEIAERNGDRVAAAAHFRAALASDPGDRYARAALADLLLDQGDATVAAELTADAWADDNLLLRRALALRALRSPDQAQAVAALAKRYAAAHARTDALHLREEARFVLHLQGNPQRALELARANWAVQKEPADACILLESAIAAGDKAQEHIALAWFRDAGVAETYLQGVVARGSARSAGAIT